MQHYHRQCDPHAVQVHVHGHVHDILDPCSSLLLGGVQELKRKAIFSCLVVFPHFNRGFIYLCHLVNFFRSRSPFDPKGISRSKLLFFFLPQHQVRWLVHCRSDWTGNPPGSLGTPRLEISPAHGKWLLLLVSGVILILFVLPLLRSSLRSTLLLDSSVWWPFLWPCMLPFFTFICKFSASLERAIL